VRETNTEIVRVRENILANNLKYTLYKARQAGRQAGKERKEEKQAYR
jgi:hypothetical protein